jgi:hypothetical protein
LFPPVNLGSAVRSAQENQDGERLGTVIGVTSRVMPHHRGVRHVPPVLGGWRLPSFPSCGRSSMGCRYRNRVAFIVFGPPLAFTSRAFLPVLDLGNSQQPRGRSSTIR